MRTFVACSCVVLGLLASISARSVQRPETEAFDILIRRARVMDGMGNPWVRADVGVREGRIAAVGKLNGATAARVIDAADRVLAPGFIDVHSHAGESLTRETLRDAAPMIAQGVTTIFINPDGGGPLDLAAQRRQIEAGGIGVNVAQLIGHGSVRRAVLGTEAREPTASELVAMEALVGRGMGEGAFGLSSGLFYIPGRYAKTEEVIALARVAAAAGGVCTSHVRDEGDYGAGVVAAVDEVIRIADEGGLRGIVTHMKALGPDNWGKGAALLEHIDAARARGVEVFADQYPYEASSTNLQAALLPDGDNTDPAAREAVATENLRRRGGADSIVIAFCRSDRTLEGKSLAQIAQARGVTAVAAALGIIAQGGASIVSFNMSEKDIEAIMRAPYTMASSDGALVEMGSGVPHPRGNGSFARRLARYVRERKVVPLEFAIRAMTSLPASVFRMKDRGVIREGAVADLVLFDPDRIQDMATYQNPHQLATGVSDVVVNGTLAMEGGKLTGARKGRVLRLSVGN
ncbi:MAG: D-aminoacylase [Acidobacteria bacterium]|nr:D-aminoacylase [Acidobacteriota bacterium]